MTDKTKLKYEYWETLKGFNFAHINHISSDEYNEIKEDDLPEDIMNLKGKYVKCSYDLSPEKIMLYNSIKSTEKLVEIEGHIKFIKILLIAMFSIAAVLGIIAVISLL